MIRVLKQEKELKSKQHTHIIKQNINSEGVLTPSANLQKYHFSFFKHLIISPIYIL